MSDDIFRRSWPRFMDLLGTDRAEATDRFAIQMRRYLDRQPPWPVARLPQEDRDDFAQDLYMHFEQNDCAKLRTYRDQGNPMVSWIVVVSSRFAKRWVKKLPQDLHLDWDPPGRRANPGDIFLRKITRECLELIEARSRPYRLLLEFFGDGYKPREMIGPMGYRPGDNKKVFNHLQQAKKWLMECVKKKGIGKDDVF